MACSEALAAEHVPAVIRAAGRGGTQELFGAILETLPKPPTLTLPRVAGEGTRQASRLERRQELLEEYEDLLERKAFEQFLVHSQHAAFQRRQRERGVAVYGDLQIGLAPRDAWAWRGLFLRDLVMGAPPSRTTPIGQPWGYPVLDPALTRAGATFAGTEAGATSALAFVRLRIEKMLREYDGLRIDHPLRLGLPLGKMTPRRPARRLPSSAGLLPVQVARRPALRALRDRAARAAAARAAAL